MDETVEPFPVRPEIPSRYRLLRVLAETEMSSVYLAEDTELNDRKVAIKALGPELVHRAGFLERFRREVDLVAALEHPNVIPIFEAKATADLCYLVMPYVDGPNLRRLLHLNGPLGMDATVHLARQIAAALDTAHEAGLVHRDVKPANVLVEPRTRHVYLCDFGIATTGSSKTITPDGHYVGTPLYAAPEQIRSLPVDRRCDVYALGCVVYECLTGEPPFVRDSPAAVLHAHLHDQPTAPPGLPASVGAVISRAMAKNPGDRYPTCTAMVDELIAAADGRPTTPPLPEFQRLSRWQAFRRRPGPLIGTAAAVIALLVAAAVIFLPEGEGGSGPELDPAALARVPEAVRVDCQGGGSGLPGATAVATCRDATVSLFADRAAMDAAYEGVRQQAGVTRGTGDCASETGAEHRNPATGRARGRMLCHSRDGQTTVLWTVDADTVIVRASSADDKAVRAKWATAPEFPTQQEKDLIDLLGERDCKRLQAGHMDRAPEAVVGLDCPPDAGGARSVAYFRFATLPELQRTYDAHVTAVRAPTGVYCPDGKAPGFLANRRYDIRSVEVGSVLCYPGPQSTLVMEWSAEPLLILGQAIGSDVELLTGWWKNNHGPRTAPLVAAVNQQADPPFPSEQERALLEHIPPASRTNCIRPSPEQVRVNVPGSTQVVGIVCGPTAGTPIVFYYQFPDAVAMRANYEAGGYPKGPDCTTLPPNFSGESTYSRGGSTGRLLCHTHEKGFRYMSWTDERLAIQAFAFQGYQPADMIAWWHTQAGPV
ncbi:serine/threonine protein kinase [Herbihabitans rhizosphaerae]|uniref:non-specific serine/threonine protein kinase n=1 Tax=Herbihabitans rhizosphaerae TaxID=1872711 RepID=A0A4Q7KFI7_9PSEU|nr:serine/threonine-protein kinase [Herbihabitans rhizosphaerae]RZS32642.1 serine/threonine protein kinase [Herbihabitans rhizosphaerae]